jgi:hypothetical protein
LLQDRHSTEAAPNIKSGEADRAVVLLFPQQLAADQETANYKKDVDTHGAVIEKLPNPRGIAKQSISAVEKHNGDNGESSPPVQCREITLLPIHKALFIRNRIGDPMGVPRGLT